MAAQQPPSKPNTAIPVRRLTLSERKPAAATLAEAFATDRVARYFIDTPSATQTPPATKWTQHARILEHITAAHILRGVAVTAGPAYACVALWLPPGTHTDGFVTSLRSGLWRLRYQLPAEGRARFFDEFMPLLHETKSAVLGGGDGEAWYLVYIGTRPGARGRGYARACVQWGIDRAQREGRPVYLESSHEGNVAIYRRMGFEVVRRIELKGLVVCGTREVDRGQGSEDGEAGGEDDKVVALDIMVREAVGSLSNRGLGVAGRQPAQQGAVASAPKNPLSQSDIEIKEIQTTMTVLHSEGV